MVFILLLPGRSFQSLQLLFVLELPRSLFILPMTGLFCNQNFLLLNCVIMYLGGVPNFLVTTSFQVVVPVGGSLDAQWSGLPV